MGAQRYIELIGFVGDASVLPTLRVILEDDPRIKVFDSRNDRCIYHAINAVTRLMKKDVREKPVEEMDLEKNRKKVLEMLGEKK